jgi:hypothetical protein
MEHIMRADTVSHGVHASALLPLIHAQRTMERLSNSV